MKIAFDIQPVLNGTKSGIGFHTDGMVKNVIKKHPDNEYLFYFFNFHQRNDVLERLHQYKEAGKSVKPLACSFMSGKVYRMIWNIIRIPYACFFKEPAEITHFFNFCIPPGVKGKKVVTIHDMAFKRYSQTVRFRTKMMLRLNLKQSIKRADAIVTVSQFTKDEILQFYRVSDEKISVVPNGVDLQKFHSNYDLTSIEKVKKKFEITEEYFLYLGTLEPRKNLVRLIEAYEEVMNKLGNHAPTLVLAGGKGWMYEEILKKREESKHPERIIFTSYLAEEDTPLLLSGATAFCFPSLYEGFGMPVLEAMACGVPVLTSNSTALTEIAKDAALLVNPFSVDEIADGMMELYQNKELREHLIAMGHRRTEQYTWDVAAEKLFSVYQKVCERNPKN